MASNRSRIERFLLPALFVALLSSCATSPKVAGRSKTLSLLKPSALLGDCDVYVRLDMKRGEGFVLGTIGGIFGEAAAADMRQASPYLSDVYLGLNVSGAEEKSLANIVVTGSFTPMHYSFIFTPKNGWEKITVSGEKGRHYPVFRAIKRPTDATDVNRTDDRQNPPFLIYGGLSGALLISTDVPAMLDRLYDSAYSASTNLPAWLTRPIPQKSDAPRAGLPFDAYVPRLAPLAGSPDLQSLLKGGFLDKSTFSADASPIRVRNTWALNVTLDVDVQNSSLKNVAATVLGVLFLPYGGTVRQGEGSHVLVENLILSQAKIQETLVNFLTKR